MLRKPRYAFQLKNRLKSWFDTHRGFMHVLLVHDEIFRTVSCQPCGIVRELFEGEDEKTLLVDLVFVVWFVLPLLKQKLYTVVRKPNQIIISRPVVLFQ